MIIQLSVRRVVRLKIKKCFESCLRPFKLQGFPYLICTYRLLNLNIPKCTPRFHNYWSNCGGFIHDRAHLASANAKNLWWPTLNPGLRSKLSCFPNDHHFNVRLRPSLVEPCMCLQHLCKPNTHVSLPFCLSPFPRTPSNHAWGLFPNSPHSRKCAKQGIILGMLICSVLSICRVWYNCYFPIPFNYQWFRQYPKLFFSWRREVRETPSNVPHCGMIVRVFAVSDVVLLPCWSV